MAKDTINNKRIAKNTLFLYFRTLLTMFVSLYTSRVVLATLGIVDFGVNNVVGGVVTMFAFLNHTMNTSTQRYLTFSLGKGNLEDSKKVFGIAIRIHILIGLLVVFLCESIGVWMVNYKLVIPPDRLFAANCVFQLTLLSFFINVSQVPYNAAIVAHERMDVYAYISILDVTLKLLAVYMLTVIDFDKLIMNSVLFFLVTQTIRMTYRFYCMRHFEECHFTYVKDKKLFKEMFQFAGWNLFGSLAWMLRDQGVNIILNLFLGPTVNAARGVAVQVSHAVRNFVHNFSTAVKPQITKSYAQGRLEEMETLTYRASKFSFFLLFFLAFPLLINVDYVLSLWLKQVPDYSGIFIILMLSDSMINAIFGQPMITSMMATGKIRNYQVVVSVVLLGIVPCGYVALSMGCSAPTVFCIMIFFTFMSGLARFGFCVKQIHYSVSRFIKTVIVPVLLVLVLALPLPMLAKNLIYIDNRLLLFLTLAFIAALCECCAIWSVGLSKGERTAVLQMIRNKINKKKK